MPLRVLGYREFIRACAAADRGIVTEVRDLLRRVGEIVRRDAAARFDRYSERSAAGYRVRVRQRGVDVEQTLRKTTGTRGDWGALQMREALVPAAEDNAPAVEREAEQAVDDVIDLFELRARWQRQGLL